MGFEGGCDVRKCVSQDFSVKNIVPISCEQNKISFNDTFSLWKDRPAVIKLKSAVNEILGGILLVLSKNLETQKRKRITEAIGFYEEHFVLVHFICFNEFCLWQDTECLLHKLKFEAR